MLEIDLNKLINLIKQINKYKIEVSQIYYNKTTKITLNCLKMDWSESTLPLG